jgi:hypothetical protein
MARSLSRLPVVVRARMKLIPARLMTSISRDPLPWECAASRSGKLSVQPV